MNGNGSSQNGGSGGLPPWIEQIVHNVATKYGGGTIANDPFANVAQHMARVGSGGRQLPSRLGNPNGNPGNPNGNPGNPNGNSDTGDTGDQADIARRQPTTGFGALMQRLYGLGGDIGSAIGQRYGPLNVPAGAVAPDAPLGGPPALPGGAMAAPAPPGGLPSAGVPGGPALPTFARPDVPALGSIGGPGGNLSPGGSGQSSAFRQRGDVLPTPEQIAQLQRWATSYADPSNQVMQSPMTPYEQQLARRRGPTTGTAAGMFAEPQANQFPVWQNPRIDVRKLPPDLAEAAYNLPDTVKDKFGGRLRESFNMDPYSTDPTQTFWTPPGYAPETPPVSGVKDVGGYGRMAYGADPQRGRYTLRGLEGPQISGQSPMGTSAPAPGAPAGAPEARIPSPPSLPGPPDPSEAREELQRTYPNATAAQINAALPRAMQNMATARANNFKLQTEQYNSAIRAYTAQRQAGAEARRGRTEEERLGIEKEKLGLEKQRGARAAGREKRLAAKGEREVGVKERKQQQEAAIKAGPLTPAETDLIARLHSYHPDAIPHLLANPETGPDFDTQFKSPGLADKIIAHYGQTAAKDATSEEDTGEDTKED